MFIVFIIFQEYLEEGYGQCRGKGRRISFLFSCIIFLYALIRVLAWAFAVSLMGTKMKGIFKGFKYLSNIFVTKERELEIGCPTDVKHVAHIGWDGPSGNNAPSWMNQFKKGPDFAAASIGNTGSTNSPWTSQGVGESNRGQSAPEEYKDSPSKEVHVNTKKQKRRKPKATSPPKSSAKSSRPVKSKAKFVEDTARPAAIEVA